MLLHYHSLLREKAAAWLGVIGSFATALYAWIHSFLGNNRKASIIMFEGNIGVGKTTFVKALAERFHYEAAPEVIGERFLKAFYAEPDRYGFALQMTQHAQRAALVRLSLLRDASARTLLLDRSIVGDYAFALWNAAIGNLDMNQWALYREQAGDSVGEALRRHVPSPEQTTIVFLYDEAKQCIARQASRDGTAIDTVYMLGLEAAHFVALACVPREYTLIELRWKEYAARHSLVINDVKHAARRSSLHQRALVALSTLVYSTKARAFLRSELTRNAAQ